MKMYLMAERKYVDKYGGGLFRNYNGILDILLPIISAKEYTLHDKINYGIGSLFSLEHLWDDVITDNLLETIDSVQIPVYFFQGVYDYQTSYIVAKEFYNHLKAPKKQFFTFENSAHCPIFDDPYRFNTIIKEILTKE
jgi:pimeloyl-ACP methyl ester carboxylesterase